MTIVWAGLRVVIVNWRDLDHPQAGGAEVFAERIARETAAAGALVTLLAARPPGAQNSRIRNGFRIRRSGDVFTVYPAALLWLLVHRRRIDVVIDCQNGIPFFTPLVLRRRTPVVQVLHHVHQQQFGLFFSPAVAFIGRQLEARGVRAVYGRRPLVAVSPSTRNEAREVLRLRGARFLVPNGLDPVQAAPGRERSPLPTLVYVGRLVRHKRLELLLAALPETLSHQPDLVLHVVGDGPDAARLRAAAAASGVPEHAVVWHGFLPAAERDELIRRSWLFVNPTRGEGWGLGVLEAAALGVPALAFRVPGLRDAVRDGQTGWLIDDGTPLAPALLAALTTLADPQQSHDYQAACEEWSGRFTWARSTALLGAVVAAETARLRAGRERRRLDTSEVLVEVPARPGSLAGPSEWTLRSTDHVAATGSGYRVLLNGADARDARVAFERNGVDLGAGSVRDADAADLVLAATSDDARSGPAPVPEARRAASDGSQPSAIGRQ